ncbi:MAG: hypothetical protein L6R38_008302 [Xanthoria sp. 2 TBL-2021]|nr:MAG: hypothetical protein L6R38_008302 [Xanthoria sp. 2 TBL-2021]
MRTQLVAVGERRRKNHDRVKDIWCSKKPYISGRIVHRLGVPAHLQASWHIRGLRLTILTMPRIEDANGLPLTTYRATFLPTRLDSNAPNAIAQGPYSISFESSSTITAVDFEACFDLIASSSANAYATSSIGWSPVNKRKEMKLPDLRYLLLKDATKQIHGFLSSMLTYEDGREVVYCYELHLSPAVQRQGLGKHLMSLMETIGMNAEVEKSMLTVFVENDTALKFYGGLGYSKDDYSPEPRKMRNGTVKMPTYVILSKSLQEWGTDEEELEDG